MTITPKQRRNAQREHTSIVCAGCDGPKPRGAAFCRRCDRVLVDKGFSLSGPLFFEENYMDRLTFLLSGKGQRLRQAVAT